MRFVACFVPVVIVAFATLVSAQEQCPPRIAASGSSPEDLFGRYVTPAGDMNGDGHEDLFVSAREYTGAGSSARNVRLISGQDGVEIYTVFPAQYPSHFGQGSGRVAVTGDLNGDGINEFIVGDPNEGLSNDPKSGEVIFFSGKDGTMIGEIEGPLIGSEFGDHVVSIGDIDGDSFPDFVVSAPDYETDTTDRTGAVFVFSGATQTLLGAITNDEVNAQTVHRTSTYFPADLAAAGDINADGYPDFILSDFLADNGIEESYEFDGLVVAISGRDLSVIEFIVGPLGSLFGESISGVGDLNGDGHAEVLVGAPDAEPNGVFGAGAAFVVDGRSIAQGAPAALYTLLGSVKQFANFGDAVEGGVDVNGDSVPDLAVAADSENASPAFPNVGRVYVYSGVDGSPILFSGGASREVSETKYGYDLAFIKRPQAIGALAIGSRSSGSVEILDLSGDANGNGEMDVCEAVPAPPQPQPETPGGGGSDSSDDTDGGGTPSGDQPQDTSYPQAESKLKTAKKQLRFASKPLPSKGQIRKASAKKKATLRRKAKKIRKARKGLIKSLRQTETLMPEIAVLSGGVSRAEVSSALEAVLSAAAKGKSKAEQKRLFSIARALLS